MIASGTILIERDALRPQCFQVEADLHPNAWLFVKHNLTSQELEKELSAKGWTFFFMASAIRTSAFGFDRERNINAALKRVIKRVRQQRCNCLQIDGVDTHSFLGMPYVSVSAHARHIQQGMAFSGRSRLDVQDPAAADRHLTEYGQSWSARNPASGSM